MEKTYSVVGRTIWPGMVVDIFPESTDTIESCPEVFRAIAVTAGSAYLLIDGTKLFIEAPVVLCLNGDETVETSKAEGLSCRIVYFKPSVVNFQITRELALLPVEEKEKSPFFQDLFWLDLFVFPNVRDRVISTTPSVMERIVSLLAILEKSLFEQIDDFWPCRSRSFFLEFLFYLRNQATGNSESNDPKVIEQGLPDKLEDILLYLHTSFCEEITLIDLCTRFAINRTSVNALFRKHLGQSVIQYLITLRVRFACLLLRDTTVPVKEIVWRSGFRDTINFYRTFKKNTSMTPLEYRQEFCFMMSG